MKPNITIHMISSLDGRTELDKWTLSPDGTLDSWQEQYITILDRNNVDMLVGSASMAEMTQGKPHPPSEYNPPRRPLYMASCDVSKYIIVLDRKGKVHFNSSEFNGIPILVLLGKDVSDSHLAELENDGVSYLISMDDVFDIKDMIRRISEMRGGRDMYALGGAHINGLLLSMGLVDKISVILTPTIDGKKSKGIFDMELHPKNTSLHLISNNTLGSGCIHLIYDVIND